jgi:hypothetical protein
MMMMKVTPIATISAGAEEIPMRAKLRTEKNRGSISANISTRKMSTIKGAHFTNVSRVKNSFTHLSPGRSKQTNPPAETGDGKRRPA